MTLLEQIRSDMITAMKAGEKDRSAALRLVLAALQSAAKDGDSNELAILRRERKRRRESEQLYREAGRDDLAKQETFEAGLIGEYLPAELSEEELSALVNSAITEIGAEGPQDFGKVMKQVLKQAEGRADGKVVSQKVKEVLS